MRALLITLLALLLLAPGSLGCCWHSLLASEQTVALATANAAASHACQHCCAECERTPAPVKPVKCKIICQSSGVYLPASKLQRAAEPLVLSLDILPENTWAARRLTAVSALGVQLTGAEAYDLPVRLHALLSCFLI